MFGTLISVYNYFTVWLVTLFSMSMQSIKQYFLSFYELDEVTYGVYWNVRIKVHSLLTLGNIISVTIRNLLWIRLIASEVCTYITCGSQMWRYLPMYLVLFRTRYGTIISALYWITQQWGIGLITYEIDFHMISIKPCLPTFHSGPLLMISWELFN